MAGHALLFLDVDGTLLPSDGAMLDATLVDWQEWQSHRNPRLARGDRAHGGRLLSLDCDLVWATAWMHDANEVIAPLLGLAPLPVADLPEAPLEDPVDALHWKTAALVAAAGGRRFVWLDDEISDIEFVVAAEIMTVLMARFPNQVAPEAKHGHTRAVVGHHRFDHAVGS